MKQFSRRWRRDEFVNRRDVHYTAIEETTTLGRVQHRRLSLSLSICHSIWIEFQQQQQRTAVQSSTPLSVSLGEIELRQKNVVNRKTIKDSRYIRDERRQRGITTRRLNKKITSTAKVKRVWRRNWPAPMPKPTDNSRPDKTHQSKFSHQFGFSSLLAAVLLKIEDNRIHKSPRPITVCVIAADRAVGPAIAIERHTRRDGLISVAIGNCPFPSGGRDDGKR